MTEPIVLFATDLEGDVAEGLSVASQLAKERAATLLVAHVVPLRTSDGVGMLHTAVDLMSVDRERDVRALSPADASVPHRSLLLFGEPDDELARVARESRASLIVMEARPRGAVERLLGPGLVARLSARADCPVVTYQPRPGQARLGGALPAPTLAPQSALAPSLALKVVLDARVDALLDWLDARVHAVSLVAGHTSIQQAVATLAATRRAGSRVLAPQVRDELVLELGEHLRATQAVGVEVWLDDAQSRADRILSLGLGAHPGPERDAWVSAGMRDCTAVSLPIASAAPDQAPIVLAVARMPLPNETTGALVFSFDARRGFLRILGQPGPSSSAETYAFDERGFMLSNSRFPDQLRSAGLLGPADQSSRQMRVCDPGIRLIDPPAPGSREAWPLTHMAASATSGHDGVDVQGYRDYRGVPVIGAWRWIPRHRFGVAAEMDVTDARVGQLRRAS
ncbi:MAG: universal stress protein [Sandaracinaceae bacterium]|nr:universal stress protein [Sandaracinaceae bacterium]